MSFELKNKDDLIRNIRESVASRGIVELSDKIDFEDLTYLKEFRCFYVYHPDVFRPMVQRGANQHENPETSRLLADMEWMTHVIKIKQANKQNHESAASFFEDHFEQVFHFPRLVDAIVFARGDTNVDPVVFKLTTGLNFYENDISLYEIVKDYADD